MEIASERKGHDDVTVILNEKPKRIPGGVYTTEGLKKALDVDASLELDLFEHGQFQPLKAGESITVRDGMKFISHVPTGGSSR